VPLRAKAAAGRGSSPAAERRACAGGAQAGLERWNDAPAFRAGGVPGEAGGRRHGPKSTWRSITASGPARALAAGCRRLPAGGDGQGDTIRAQRWAGPGRAAGPSPVTRRRIGNINALRRRTPRGPRRRDITSQTRTPATPGADGTAPRAPARPSALNERNQSWWRLRQAAKPISPAPTRSSEAGAGTCGPPGG
jgi:hypothetical protein